MIKLIYGPKGFGKTKIILSDVNEAAKVAKGNVVLITDKKFNTVSIDFNVRCVYTTEYGIGSAEEFDGFIKGLIAGNSDIEYLFIDGLAKVTGTAIGDLGKLVSDIKKFNEVNGLKVEMTVSATKEELPPFLSELAD